MPSGEIRGFKGTLIHSKSFNELEIINNGFIGVNEAGKIEFVKDLDRQEHQNALLDPTISSVVELGDAWLIPGFIDGHCHAPQYSYLGIGMHLPLLDWLETYTFPKEAKFADSEYARRVYTSSVKRHLLSGTTTCSYFATIHLEASKILADIVQELGQRGFIGKVNMDRNAPKTLIEETDESIRSTREFVKYCKDKNDPLVTPVITPRFVPSTTPRLMQELGKISREHEPLLPIQSHLSENEAEIDWVKSMHPECDSYTAVYDQHGLLHERTYMAHCIWCSKNERQVLKQRQTAVVHCPNSNFNLSSGILNVRRLIAEGIKVGLGTDVSGGSSTSMLDAIRHAVIASKLVSAGRGSSSRCETDTYMSCESLSYIEAFYLATMGGAECLGIDDTVGNFKVGKEFDALVINLHAKHTPIDPHPGESIKELFQRFLFVGDDRHIEQVYVQGKSVRPSL